MLGALAVALAIAPGLAAGATAPLGGPDAPPSAPPAVSLPAPAAPEPAAPLVPAVPDAPSAAGAAPSSAPAAPAARRPTGAASADRVAAERVRAAAAARMAAAARARARARAVTRIGDGIDRRLDTASTILARWASTSARSVERAGGPTGAGVAPSAVLALLLLFVSGLTAGVVLLPRHRDDSAAAAPRPGAVAFVERHRLELAGVAMSCLLTALLVFVGL